MTCLDIMSLIFLRFFRGRKEKELTENKIFSTVPLADFHLPSDFGPILMFVELSFPSLKVDYEFFNSWDNNTGTVLWDSEFPGSSDAMNSYYGFIYLMLYFALTFLWLLSLGYIFGKFYFLVLEIDIQNF